MSHHHRLEYLTVIIFSTSPISITSLVSENQWHCLFDIQSTIYLYKKKHDCTVFSNILNRKLVQVT